MLPDYSDIRDLIAAEPLWFDGNGVPRYAAFNPDMLGIYDKYALLVVIECQSCCREFKVGEGWPDWTIVNGQIVKYNLTDLATGYHYGDPPRHSGCVGNTMNCVDIRIREAWEKVYSSGFEWVRRPEIEAIDIYPDWAGCR